MKRSTTKNGNDNISKDNLRWLAIVLTIALSLRIFLYMAILFRNPDFFLTDTDGYWNVANNILKNAFFSHDGVTPDHFKTPVYPLFLSASKFMGLNAASIIFIQVLFSLLTCFLTILFTHNLSRGWGPAIIAGSIIASDIPSIVLANTPLTETLFTLFFTASLLFLALYFKRKSIPVLVLSGILAGLSILCRPIATFFPLFGVILVFVFSGPPKALALRRSLLYLLSCLIAVSPWLIRNKITFDSPFISTIGYYTFSDRAARFASISNENISVYGDDFKEEKFDKGLVSRVRFRTMLGARAMLRHPVVTLTGFLRSVSFMLFKPIRTDIDIQLGILKEGNTLTPWTTKAPEEPLFSRFLKNTSSITIALVFIQFIMLFIVWGSFCYGMLSSFKRGEYMIFWTVIAAVSYFCITVSEPARFRVPIVPFLACAGGIGISRLYEAIRKRSRAVSDG